MTHNTESDRRAPAAPVPQSVTGLLTIDEYQEKHRQVYEMNGDERYGYECLYEEIIAGIQRPALAAAPQPPEAAPVQMPEPFAWTDDGTLRAGSSYTAHRVVTSDTKRTMHSGTAAAFHEPLYTEQQVRALLSSINHCPKT